MSILSEIRLTIDTLTQIINEQRRERLKSSSLSKTNGSTIKKTPQKKVQKQKQPYKTHSTSSSTLAALYKSEQEKKIKTLKMRRQEIENCNIRHNVQLQMQQQYKKSYFEEKSEEMSNEKEKQVLMMLYEYFKKNNQLLCEANKEINSYRTLENPKMNTTMKKSSNVSQNFSIKSRGIHTSAHNPREGSIQASVPSMNHWKNNSLGSLNCTMHNKTSKDRVIIKCPEIDLSKFPILEEILFPRKESEGNESDDMSIISDMVYDHKDKGAEKGKHLMNGETSQRRRITLESMFAKK